MTLATSHLITNLEIICLLRHGIEPLVNSESRSSKPYHDLFKKIFLGLHANTVFSCSSVPRCNVIFDGAAENGSHFQDNVRYLFSA